MLPIGSMRPLNSRHHIPSESRWGLADRSRQSLRKSCNCFVPLARLKLRLNFLLGPHDVYSRPLSNGVIGRSHRRVPTCKRPQIPVIMHKGAPGEHHGLPIKKSPGLARRD